MTSALHHSLPSSADSPAVMAGTQLTWDELPFEIRQEILLCVLFDLQNDASLLKTVQELSLVSKDFLTELRFPVKARYITLRDACFAFNREAVRAFSLHLSQCHRIMRGAEELQIDNFVVALKVSALIHRDRNRNLLPHLEEWEKAGRVLCWFDSLIYRIESLVSVLNSALSRKKTLYRSLVLTWLLGEPRAFTRTN